MQKIWSYFSHWRYFLVSFGFTLGLIILETFFFPRYYEAFYIFDNFINGNYIYLIKTLVLGTANFLLAVFFIMASLLSPYPYRILYFFLFCIAVLSEYGYQRAFNRFTTLEDIGNAFFASDMRIMFSSVGEYFVLSAIISCLLYAVLLFSVKPLLNNGRKIFLMGLITFSGFFLFTAYFSTNTYPSISYNAFYRTVYNFPVSWYIGTIHQPPYSIFYQTPRREITFRAQQLPNNNIVFIVEESMRGDHLSLNGYSRPTSPKLEELNQQGFIKNWGIASSGTTCSINSNNLLLSGVNTIPDTEGDIFRFPTIFQYAKAAGYKTFYFDGQLSYRWIGKPADVESVDEWLMPDTLKNGEWYDIDAEIARRVKEIVGNSTGNFIWINKFGVHFPYKNSYPDEAAKWLPIPQTKERFQLFGSDNESEKMINSYDNAILYNSQSFFTNLFDRDLPADTFYVYTSDHGQNLSESGGASTHCLSTKNEANVPLFIIAEPEIMPAADTGYKASHSNIFATLLDLMNFPEDERLENYSPSLFSVKQSDSKPRFFYTGNLHSKISVGKHDFDR